MALVRSAHRPRAFRTLLTQLGLSVTATVAATLIVSALQREMVSFRRPPAAAEVTSGGKFAARIEALRSEAGDSDAVVSPPLPRVPLLALDTDLQVLPIALTSRDLPAEAKPAIETTRSGKRTVHAEQRRHGPAEAAVDVVPPRRSDSVVTAMADTVSPTVADTSVIQGAWTSTKGFYREALTLGGNAVDRLNPLNLLP